MTKCYNNSDTFIKNYRLSVYQMRKIAVFLLLAATFSSCSTSKKLVTTNFETLKTDLEPVNLTSSSAFSMVGNTFDLSTIDLSPIEEFPTALTTQANRIIDYAFMFDGVRYKRGGTTKEGMDCSGFVVTTFDSENISLPRVSRDIARTGSSIDLTEVTTGDLLFFATRRNSKTISHVGIVTTVKEGFVEFIHASTSSGVIVSNLAEKYWNSAFILARRVI